ncbi:MAG TPA: nitroreductase family protein [Aggregatilinea sp.]|uniref:nitroreductase family protein n=1 Tax=Aggregatilinea sp. TaxID=2806333 RepID=UPI002D08D00D|nr:nitroreductase family protein [Aggregatilinea sp.]HML21191.1 nitroreductase family protein [Aggregatilinea sp.]
MSSLIDVIRGRRSVRRYQDRTVSDAALWRILDAARWAPSAHNRQPWRFAVLVDPARREQLARAMGERFRMDLAADGLDSDQIERQVTRSYQRISGAPAVIVVCMSMTDMDVYPDERRAGAERIMATQSVALAVQNLLLAAYDAGLGACWICAPLFCPDVVRDVLDLPGDWEAQALITLGYPAQEKTSERAPVEAKVLWF